MNLDKVTRFEVIDDTGRILVSHDTKVYCQLQDEDRTLKVFKTGSSSIESQAPLALQCLKYLKRHRASLLDMGTEELDSVIEKLEKFS